MTRTEEQWINEYQKKDALWIHDGNPKRPHALLASGNHSNGFFNSRPVIADEKLLRDAADDLVVLFLRNHGDIAAIEGVVGPQTGATKLAELVSNSVKGYTGDCTVESCFWASPAKHENEGKKSMVFSEEDLALLSGKTVLLVEDVLTTGGSVELASTAVTSTGGIVLPFILLLVNRSGLAEANGKKTLALIDREMPMWSPEDCPLCKEGSEAVRPKDNWVLLNASYY
jgi:orotate phosphoribosyltransferase